MTEEVFYQKKEGRKGARQGGRKGGRERERERMREETIITQQQLSTLTPKHGLEIPFPTNKNKASWGGKRAESRTKAGHMYAEPIKSCHTKERKKSVKN